MYATSLARRDPSFEPTSQSEQTLLRKVRILLQVISVLDADRTRLMIENQRLSQPDEVQTP
jgi:hypothetical protein